ncbi:MAG: hypothetical protein N2B06_14670 [Clostridium sp.]
MTQVEMKREPYVLRIAGILCLFNIPIILFLILNNYFIERIIGMILISLVTQYGLATYISNLLYFHHKNIVENMVKIESSIVLKKIYIVYIIVYFIFYCVLLYLLAQKGTDAKYISYLIQIMCFLAMPIWTNSGNPFPCYIGDKNFIYGNIQVKINDIDRYEVVIVKKYKKQKRDKIQLKIFPITGKEILVINSSFSYKLVEEIEKIFENRYINKKMKQYGMQQ